MRFEKVKETHSCVYLSEKLDFTVVRVRPRCRWILELVRLKTIVVQGHPIYVIYRDQFAYEHRYPLPSQERG